MTNATLTHDEATALRKVLADATAECSLRGCGRAGERSRQQAYSQCADDIRPVRDLLSAALDTHSGLVPFAL
jgi:hypothetical protein